MLYTLEELAKRCEVTPEFVRTVRQESGALEPCATVTLANDDPVEVYDGLKALVLLWIKAFVDHGWSIRDASNYADHLIDNYFGAAAEQNYPWDSENLPSDTIAMEMDGRPGNEQDE
jgi:hypothetical protein